MSGKFEHNRITGELDIIDDSKKDTITWGEKLLTSPPVYKPKKTKAAKPEKWEYQNWLPDGTFDSVKKKIENREANANDWAKDNAVWKNHLNKTLTAGIKDKPDYATYDQTTGTFIDKFGGKVAPEIAYKQQQELDALQKELKPDYARKDNFDLIVDASNTPEEKRELRELITRKHRAGLPIEPKHKKFINHPTPPPSIPNNVIDTSVDDFINMKEQMLETERRNKAFEKAMAPTVDPDLYQGLGSPNVIKKVNQQLNNKEKNEQ